jgi:CheY-like chemotaxis protein
MARILVVDDQKTMRELLREALKEDFLGGHDVIEAAEGATALIMVETEQVDLLLTNVGMPGMDGIELADTVRARQPKLPVLLMTGRAIEHIPPRWQPYYIAKPFHLRHLAQAVADALRSPD